MRLIPSDPDVATVIGRIKDGSLDLRPEFQRGEVWGRAKQRLLIDSVLRNWYVPPIHVIRTPQDTQEVLDGQQRLRAIYEFVLGRLSVNGQAEPKSEDIAALDGLYYDRLPEQVRRRFDRFTLRIFELVDYETAEPYELFYRLNQPTTLTSAEKRNAFFGPAREQVRQLTKDAEDAGMVPTRLGFSNARLAYEDIIARFVWTLEIGTLREKLTANKITERYREDTGFSPEVLSWARDSLQHFFSSSALDAEDVRLNKATIHSWLCFVGRKMLIAGSQLWATDAEFVKRVEGARTRWRGNREPDPSRPHYGLLIPIFNDRATARVNAVSTVLLRDAILWSLYYADGLSGTPSRAVDLVSAASSANGRSDIEPRLLQAIEEVQWGVLL